MKVVLKRCWRRGHRRRRRKALTIDYGSGPERVKDEAIFLRHDVRAAGVAPTPRYAGQ
jgi:hypothetical protein